MKIKLALYEEIKSCDHIMKFIKLEFKKNTNNNNDRV